MLITFSGLDGAGKTTLIEWLRESLEKKDVRVAVSHMYYDVGFYAFIRFVGGKISGQNSKGRAPRETMQTHAPRTLASERGFKSAVERVRYVLVWNKTLRLCIYPLDLLLFLFYRLYVEKLKGQVLIMDRYFYDTLVDVAEGRKWYGVRLLSLLTPTPSVPVYLDISPEEAHARKREYSVAHLSRRRLSYQRVVRGVSNMLVVASSNDINNTRRTLERAVLERMGAR